MFRYINFLRIKYLAFILLSYASYLTGQTSLFMQGSLQKSSGKPFENGFHSITFKLYEVEDGGVAIWTEEQPNVPVESGLYEASLGSVVPLNLPFNKRYYLGISVNGGDELSPRSIIGNAPYAASVTGSNNVFPTSGSVGVGTLAPDSNAYMLHLKNTSGNGTLIIEGSQRAELLLRKGSNASVGSISFDSSKISVRNIDITIKNNLELPKNAYIKYNGISDWQLVDRDDFSTDTDNWKCADAWSNNTVRNFDRINPNKPFSNKFILRPNAEGNDVLKKEFNLAGIPHTMVKVVFTYHFLDSWDNESAFAAFAFQENSYSGSPGQNDGKLHVAWYNQSPVSFNEFAFSSDPGYFKCDPTPYTDAAVQGEMSAFHSGDKFWLIIGSSLDESACNESYGISNVEIWVR